MIDEPLSPEGAKRRDAILLLAKAEARRRRSRRVVSRGMAAAVVVALAVFVIRLLPTPIKPVEVNRSIARSPSVSTTPSPSTAIEYVQTDPTITDRLTLQPSPPRWTEMKDDELLQELAAAGQPAGIVCINGKSTLLPREVAR